MKCKIQFRVICSPSKSNLAADCGYKCLLHIFLGSCHTQHINTRMVLNDEFNIQTSCLLYIALIPGMCYLYPCIIFLEWIRFASKHFTSCYLLIWDNVGIYSNQPKHYLWYWFVSVLLSLQDILNTLIYIFHIVSQPTTNWEGILSDTP